MVRTGTGAPGQSPECAIPIRIQAGTTSVTERGEPERPGGSAPESRAVRPFDPNQFHPKNADAMGASSIDTARFVTHVRAVQN